jgi:DNA-binding NarL/FixJ family response regulator
MENVSSHGTAPRFLIADDHAMFAETLKVYLEAKYAVLGIVSDGRALIEATRKLKPEVVVVDVAMPVLNGLDAARKIKEEAPQTKFVFLTMRDDPNLAAAALELGPIAFVLKHSTGSELLTAIEQILHGKSYLTPKLRAEDWAEAQARARQYGKELTPRQREIVQLLAEGNSMKEIAAVLDLSEKTVEFHKRHIMECHNLKSNSELTLFALKLGLISVDPGPAKALAVSSKR